MEQNTKSGQSVPGLRYLDGAERALSRNLWEESFPEDSKVFGDYYFTEKVKDNRILVLEENDRIDAMIQMNPYRLQVKDQQWKIDYLVGVATRKDRRHRGYMRRLLVKMMADMRSEQMPFCFLMPADEAIYRPFGFTFIYDQPQFEWNNENPLERQSVILWRNPKKTEGPIENDGWQITEPAEETLQKLSDWMNHWLADHYQVYAVRDRIYIERLLKEIASECGTLDLVFGGERIIGVESFWGLEKKVRRLLYAEDSCIKEGKEPKPAIMARIIHPERFMQVISLKDQVADEQKTVTLKIADPLIPENQGIWRWTLNHETSWLEKMAALEEETGDNQPWLKAAELAESGKIIPDLTLTITELTTWLFGYDIPKAAAAFSDIIQPLRGVFLDEVV